VHVLVFYPLLNLLTFAKFKVLTVALLKIQVPPYCEIEY